MAAFGQKNIRTGEGFSATERDAAVGNLLTLGVIKGPATGAHLTEKGFVFLEKNYGKAIASKLKSLYTVKTPIAKKSKVDPSMEPEANFAGQISVRPRDGITLAGTSQVNTPLGKHLINAEIVGRKNQKIISGGHNANNFYDILKANGGKVIGQPTTISKGITDLKYQLPNGRIESKTVYDPKVYSDTQMATMANQAAAVAIRNFGVNGVTKQTITINGIAFRVPIASHKGKLYVPTAFPVNPNTP